MAGITEYGLKHISIQLPKENLAVVTFTNAKDRRFALALNPHNIGELLEEFINIAGSLSDTSTEIAEALPANPIGVPASQFSKHQAEIKPKSLSTSELVM